MPLLLLGALVSACIEGEVVEVDSDDEVVTRCLSDAMYLVQGDIFTSLSAGWQTVTISEQGAGSGSTGWRPGVEPRAKCRTFIRGYEGSAELLWNDVVVDRLILSKASLLGQEIEVLTYRDPDGTLVEYHLYTRPSCEKASIPGPVATRAEIQALESR